jgi:hypothetical protein
MQAQARAVVDARLLGQREEEADLARAEAHYWRQRAAESAHTAAAAVTTTTATMTTEQALATAVPGRPRLISGLTTIAQPESGPAADAGTLQLALHGLRTQVCACPISYKRARVSIMCV